MGTSIIISITARAITVPYLRAASGPRSTVQSFTVRRCMTLMAMKPRADTSSAVQLGNQLVRLMHRCPQCGQPEMSH